MKSLRSTGMSTACRTSTRSSSDPPNRRRSVSTEMVAAPPAAYAAARAAGSGIWARAPLLGLERLTSAITETPDSRNRGIGSRAGSTCMTRSLRRSRLTAAWRSARSCRTPSTMLSRTPMTVSTPPAIRCVTGTDLCWTAPAPGALFLLIDPESEHLHHLADDKSCCHQHGANREQPPVGTEHHRDPADHEADECAGDPGPHGPGLAVVDVPQRMLLQGLQGRILLELPHLLLHRRVGIGPLALAAAGDVGLLCGLGHQIHSILSMLCAIPVSRSALSGVTPSVMPRVILCG